MTHQPDCPAYALVRVCTCGAAREARHAPGYVEIVKPDASPRDMEAIRERLPEVQEAIAAGKLVFVVAGMTLRWHPFGIDAERARHAALVEAASGVALDYHAYAIEGDVSHPAVTWGRCTDPKCAALRAALGDER